MANVGSMSCPVQALLADITDECGTIADQFVCHRAWREVPDTSSSKTLETA